MKKKFGRRNEILFLPSDELMIETVLEQNLGYVRFADESERWTSYTVFFTGASFLTYQQIFASIRLLPVRRGHENSPEQPNR